MAFLPLIAIAATVASAAIGGYGAYQQGQAGAAAAHYNAGVARQNAAVSSANAQIAEQSGEAQAGIYGQKTRAQVGSTIARQAASGVEVNSGSHTDVVSSERELGELDALTARSNAAREAYGYRVQTATHKGQSNLDMYEGAADIQAGDINAASTLLGGAGKAASQYQQWQLQSGQGMTG